MTKAALLRAATHVAFDAATTESLLNIGAINVVRASDCLIVGPSRLDALEHARTRETWRSLFEESSFRDESGEPWDRLYSPDIRWGLPVVLWVSVSLRERVNLWRACRWLRHLGIASGEVLVAEFEFVFGTINRSCEPPIMPRFNCSASVAHHPNEVLLDRLDTACPWPVERYEHAVRLWECYVDDNPLLFVESCIRGVDGFPELAPLWGLLSCFFPRQAAGGTLRLSRLDELILTILSTEENLTAVSVFCHKSQFGLDLRELLSCTGDLFLRARLDQWAKHGSAAVERAPGPRPPNAGSPMRSKVYRLTERGMQLRDKGLDRLTDAPSLPIAGTEAYSPSAPWVLLEDGRLSRL
ncbi:hypothetical protein SOCE836_084450 [Sorangium cellulosum]|uniref:DUF1835 domain-containing protein n=2 Tax=Polyangiaceae TaxID=49 RepID=A0A4P2R0U0_SORCE|nr:hypothetical protein SOCE836_084450 [Sorangium cellulosum]WCQ95540.1 hypothetical protein NQZ70_08317 [Sorangium sp. Soce836]